MPFLALAVAPTTQRKRFRLWRVRLDLPVGVASGEVSEGHQELPEDGHRVGLGVGLDAGDDVAGEAQPDRGVGRVGPGGEAEALLLRLGLLLDPCPPPRRPLQELLGGVTLTVGLVEVGRRRVDQVALDRLGADDGGVILGVARARGLLEDLAEPGDVLRLLGDVAAPSQLLPEDHAVDAVAAVGQVGDRLVDLLVEGAVEIVGPAQDGADLGEGVGVDDESREEELLGLEVVGRESVGGAIVASGPGEDPRGRDAVVAVRARAVGAHRATSPRELWAVWPWDPGRGTPRRRGGGSGAGRGPSRPAPCKLSLTRHSTPRPCGGDRRAPAQARRPRKIRHGRASRTRRVS